MKVEYYRTILCPRCLYVSQVLKEIKSQHPDLEIEFIEITTNISRTRAAGIHSVPSLKIGNALLTGLFLTQEKIQRFIGRHLEENR